MNDSLTHPDAEPADDVPEPVRQAWLALDADDADDAPLDSPEAELEQRVFAGLAQVDAAGPRLPQLPPGWLADALAKGEAGAEEPENSGHRVAWRPAGWVLWVSAAASLLAGAAVWWVAGSTEPTELAPLIASNGFAVDGELLGNDNAGIDVEQALQRAQRTFALADELAMDEWDAAGEELDTLYSLSDAATGELIQ
jgi:hypothetical protein